MLEGRHIDIELEYLIRFEYEKSGRKMIRPPWLIRLRDLGEYFPLNKIGASTWRL